MTRVLVTWLRPEHLSRARELAVAVEERCARRGARDRAGIAYAPAKSLENRIGGYEAEIACSIWVDLPWRDDLAYKKGAPDVGDDIDVKWRSRRNWDLVVERDIAEAHPDWRFVLARGRFPGLELVGWLYGHEASTFPLDNFGYKERVPKHLIPAARCRPMQTLEPALFRGVRVICEICDDELEIRGDVELWRGRCIPCLTRES